jgi:hypothetical protein
MQFDFTAKDKHALKSLSVDLRDMFSMKGWKIDWKIQSIGKIFDASFFRTVEGNYIDEMLDWVVDFGKRMENEKSKESKEQLDSETKELVDAGTKTNQ